MGKWDRCRNCRRAYASRPLRDRSDHFEDLFIRDGDSSIGGGVPGSSGRVGQPLALAGRDSRGGVDVVGGGAVQPVAAADSECGGSKIQPLTI